MRPRYAAMDVLCLPTRREGFPNVVLEAGAAGVPCITTRATGAIDSVVDGTTGVLVDVGDEEGLRRAIDRLARDPALREAMSEAARERVIDEFPPERIWTGMQSVLAGRPNADVRRV